MEHTDYSDSPIEFPGPTPTKVMDPYADLVPDYLREPPVPPSAPPQAPVKALPPEPIISLEPLLIIQRTRRFPLAVRRAIVYCRAHSERYSAAVLRAVRCATGH